MSRRTRFAYYLGVVVTVLLGFTMLYNYGMAVWEGRPQPMFRSLEVVLQTFTTAVHGASSP